MDTGDTPGKKNDPADRQAGPRPSKVVNEAVCLMAFALMTGPNVVADLLLLPDGAQGELPLIGITAFAVCLLLHYGDLVERRRTERLSGSMDRVGREGKRL